VQSGRRPLQNEAASAAGPVGVSDRPNKSSGFSGVGCAGDALLQTWSDEYPYIISTQLRNIGPWWAPPQRLRQAETFTAAAYTLAEAPCRSWSNRIVRFRSSAVHCEQSHLLPPPQLTNRAATFYTAWKTPEECSCRATRSLHIRIQRTSVNWVRAIGPPAALTRGSNVLPAR
jgi:hypothetical protein